MSRIGRKRPVIYKTTRFFLHAIVHLVYLLMAFLLVVAVFEFNDMLDSDWLSNPESLHRPFTISEPVSFRYLVDEYWPREIIIAVCVYLLLIGSTSDTVSNLVGKVTMSGNQLIPSLILVYFSAIFIYILAKGPTYPSSLSDATVVRVMLFGGGGSQLLIPMLFSVNDSLAKPSTMPTFVACLVLLYACAYVAFVTWVNYLYSGEIDIAYKLNIGL